jgi:hypothetical protein
VQHLAGRLPLPPGQDLALPTGVLVISKSGPGKGALKRSLEVEYRPAGRQAGPRHGGSARRALAGHYRTAAETLLAAHAARGQLMGLACGLLDRPFFSSDEIAREVRGGFQRGRIRPARRRFGSAGSRPGVSASAGAGLVLQLVARPLGQPGSLPCEPSDKRRGQGTGPHRGLVVLDAIYLACCPVVKVGGP